MNDRPAMIIGMDVLGTAASLGIDFKNHDVYLASTRSNGKSLQQMPATSGERVSH